MNRYKFDNKSVTAIKQYLKGNVKKKPTILNKYSGTLEKGQLLIEGKRVIPEEKVDTFLRKEVTSGNVPLTRDGLYYYTSKNIVGISRKRIDDFLKKQRVIRVTDNAQPTSKKTTSRKVHKKGILEFDLIEINWDDLKFTPDDIAGIDDAKAGYIFSLGDVLTGLTFVRYSPDKSYSNITPIAEEGFKYMSDKLKVPLSKLFATSDKGSEFDFKKYKTWGVRVKTVPRGNFIENKNAQIQRTLYRIAKFKNTKKLKELLKQTMNIVNNTQSSLTKVTPLEALDKSLAQLTTAYNKRKGEPVVNKKKELKKGDMVRVNLIEDKNKTSFYKAYKGVTWSKGRFEVLGKRSNKYKINFKGRKQFIHRDRLRLTSEFDSETDKVIRDREMASEKKETAKRKQRRKKADTKLKQKYKKQELTQLEGKKVVPQRRRSSRLKVAQAGVDKRRLLADYNKELDKFLSGKRTTPPKKPNI